MAGEVKANVLSRIDTGRLFRWLEENRVEAGKYPARDVAVSASRALGLTITESNVGSARRQLGIIRPVREPSNEEGWKQLAADLRIVAGVLVHLMGNPPQDLRRIAGRTTTRQQELPGAVA